MNNSVLGQTYSSTDGTVEIVQSYGDKCGDYTFFEERVYFIILVEVYLSK